MRIQHTRPPFACVHCGTLFRAKRRHRKDPQFCGQTCHGAHRRRSAEALIALFWSRVDRSSTEGCWPWTGSRRNAHGYGGFWNGTRWGYAHRFAYRITYGDLDKADLVCHTCDNPPCCRPDHLFKSNHAGNVRDMVSKGRNGNRISRGEENPAAKLTASQVVEIRSRHAAGGVTYRQLALSYGVDSSTVGGIIRREIWAHVP